MTVDVQLPDGSVAKFPDGTPDAEIEAILHAQVAQISYLDDVGWWVVKRAGVAFGYRRTLAEATALASNLPPPPLPPRRSEPQPEPQHIAVSLHEAGRRIDRAIARQQAADRQVMRTWRDAERRRGR